MTPVPTPDLSGINPKYHDEIVAMAAAGFTPELAAVHAVGTRYSRGTTHVWTLYNVDTIARYLRVADVLPHPKGGETYQNHRSYPDHIALLAAEPVGPPSLP